MGPGTRSCSHRIAKISLTLIAAVVGVALLEAVAEPGLELRKFESKLLDIEAPDGRVVATEKGFVALERGNDGDRIVHRDREGKEIEELAKTGNRVANWWVAPKGNAVAYESSEGKLSIRFAGCDTPQVESSYFDGAVSFSPNGRRVAFRTERSVIAREEATTGKRIEIPASKVSEGPFWSGDGESLVTLVGELKVVGGTRKSAPDTIEYCNPFAEKVEWKKVFQNEGASVSHLATDCVGRRLAFLEEETDHVKLRLFDLDKGEIKTSYGMQATRSISFAPSGELLITFFVRKGGNDVMLLGSVDLEGHGFHSAGGDRLFEGELISAVAGGRDVWITTRLAGKESPQIVRVTPKP